jgi:hypothetical protein
MERIIHRALHSYTTTSLHKYISVVGAALNKYTSIHRYNLQNIPTASRALGDQDFAKAGVSEEHYHSLINSSIAKSTWEKYSSALNTFSCFEAACCKTFSWPLSVETCRAFIIWCHQSRKLQTSTIKSYLSGIKFIHTLKNLHSSHITDDLLIPLLLRGVSHVNAVSNPHNNTRRVVTFPLLLQLGHRIANTTWSPLTKQVVWSASTTGFFASTRMGEILAKGEHTHAPDSDLTWTDVRESSSTSLLIRIKQPKSGENCEFVDLFPFPGFQCCPVAALRALKKKQILAGSFDESLPVFRFDTGKNLTQSQLNRTLQDLLSDLCTPGQNTISCHSFRAGIPSTLSLFPHLATDDMIKGWGRWQSDCYQRYTRLKLPQKKEIFDSISVALQSSLNH